MPPALATAATVAQAVRAMTSVFRDAGLDTPSVDARRLAGYALALDAIGLVRSEARPLTSTELRRLTEVTSRRLAHEPVSRIEGARAFHGLSLRVSPATLDPRPDTETLVEGVLGLVAAGRLGSAGSPLRILDLGTGTGAILISLLARLSSASGVGVDISADALTVAASNAAQCGVAGRASFQRTDWCRGIEGVFDLVVSNPPYIPSVDIAALAPEVRLYDPSVALDGGADGLDAYRRIVAEVPRVLAVGGWLAVEVGAGQAPAVIDLIEASPAFQVARPLIWRDLGGISRCVAAEARGG